MTPCLKCRADTIDLDYGPWCDTCGGVVVSGPDGPRLFFRHVATVYGAGGHYPVVWDPSTSDYMTLTQKANPRAASRDEDGLRPPPLVSYHGSLDAVLAQIQPHAKGESAERPSLAPAPSATPEEMSLLRQ